MALTKRLPEVNTDNYNKKVSVSSSFIAAIGYEPHIGAIAVWFKNGSHAAYIGCSPEEFSEFLNTTSKGKFYTSRIKGKKTPTLAVKR